MTSWRPRSVDDSAKAASSGMPTAIGSVYRPCQLTPPALRYVALSMTTGTTMTAASNANNTTTLRREAQSTAAKKRKTSRAVHGTHVSAGDGVSSQPKTPTISRYRDTVAPSVMRTISVAPICTGSRPESVTSSGLKITFHATWNNDDAMTSAAQRRAQEDCTRFRTAARLLTPRIVSAMSPSQSGPSWRVSPRTQPAMPTVATNQPSTRSCAREMSRNPQTHTAIEAAISGPLGFTTLSMKRTMGVIASTTPTASSLGAANRLTAAIAVAISVLVINALRNLMR